MKLTVTSAVAAAAVLTAGSAVAQQSARVTINDTADYETALACFQYYGIAEQISAARIGQDGAPPEQVEAETVRGQVAKAMKTSWNQRIESVKGEKSNEQINADLEEVSAPLVATANAALGGDQAAVDKHNATQAECNSHEKIEEVQG